MNCIELLLGFHMFQSIPSDPLLNTHVGSGLKQQDQSAKNGR